VILRVQSEEIELDQQSLSKEVKKQKLKARQVVELAKGEGTAWYEELGLSQQR
jgi:hypothetical protein